MPDSGVCPRRCRMQWHRRRQRLHVEALDTGLNVEDAFSDLVRRLRRATIGEVTLVADSAGREGHSWPVALWDGVLACLRGCCSPRKLAAGGLRKSQHYELIQARDHFDRCTIVRMISQ
jgi:hypothetical protein